MVVIGGVLTAITSRAGMVAIALVAGYLVGHSAASKGEAVRRLNTEVAGLRAALAISEVAAEQAAKEAATLRAHQVEQQGVLDAYEKELAERGDGDACRLNDADLERLRKLR